nr:Chain B, Survival motor neuron protein [Homo sapiens]
GMRPPPPGIRG